MMHKSSGRSGAQADNSSFVDPEETVDASCGLILARLDFDRLNSKLNTPLSLVSQKEVVSAVNSYVLDAFEPRINRDELTEYYKAIADAASNAANAIRDLCMLNADIESPARSFAYSALKEMGALRSGEENQLPRIGFRLAAVADAAAYKAQHLPPPRRGRRKKRSRENLLRKIVDLLSGLGYTSAYTDPYGHEDSPICRGETLDFCEELFLQIDRYFPKIQESDGQISRHSMQVYISRLRSKSKKGKG